MSFIVASEAEFNLKSYIFPLMLLAIMETETVSWIFEDVLLLQQ